MPYQMNMLDVGGIISDAINRVPTEPGLNDIGILPGKMLTETLTILPEYIIIYTL